MTKEEAIKIIKVVINKLDPDQIRDSVSPMIMFGNQVSMIFDNMGIDMEVIEELIAHEEFCAMIAEKYPHHFKNDGEYIEVIK